MDPATKREHDTRRKREYRAMKRQERDHCCYLIYYLEDRLKQKQIHQGKTTQQSTILEQFWRHRADRSFQERCESTAENHKLRDHVRRHGTLLRALHQWVSVLQPPIALPDNINHMPWLQTTLLADPVARHVGYEWLTDRVYHSIARTGGAVDGGGFLATSSIDDVAQVDVVLDDAKWDILGLFSRQQRTVLAPFQVAADSLWADQGRQLHAKCLVSVTQAVELDGCLDYTRTHNRHLGTSFCTLARRYNLHDRVVMVYVFLREDECVPLQGGEIRPHGFGFNVFHHITDHVTLLRSSMHHFTPVTPDGPLLFDQTAALFGIDAASSDNRNTTIVRIEQEATRHFDARGKDMAKSLHAQLTRTEARVANET
ncbi:Aste57867_16463 [Aphanomyces stellatus]|uniref:Aste57867_16463 protein n=1 Tax=Aphanomyces stellatus TaxID=120398 RepID=A0A485L5H8_9STRA|nr:hypothetical protein As57867_016406 [Aphanomyces stellatus]VFT93237.1 Aste57867_16463 [Aphanomyces stellatus]